MYNDSMLFMAGNSSLLLAFYFLIITIFNDRVRRVHSFIICVFSFVGYLLPPTTNNTIQEFISKCQVSMLLDGGTALVLGMFLVFDRLAWRQALILAFATTCHIMVILHLINNSSTGLVFYNWYDELIILIGLIQMAISYEGITNALSNIRVCLLRIGYCCYNIGQSIYIQAKRKDKA